MKKLILLLLAFITSINFTNAQWQQTNGPYGGYIRCLTASGTNIFAGTSNNGVFLSTDTGTIWTAVNSGLTDSSYVSSLAVNGTNIFAGTANYGVFLSTDTGKIWTPVNSGLTDSSLVYSLAANGTNIFAGTFGGVFLSTDTGKSWTATGLGNVSSFAVSGTNIYVGVQGGAGVFLSTDTAKTWTSGTGWGLTDAYVNSVAVIGTNIFAATGDGVFLSTDQGTIWTAVNSGLTDSSVSSYAAFAVSGTNIFVGTDAGVFLSTNNGSTWTAINKGLTDTVVYSLSINKTYLFAGTNGGVYILKLSDVLPCAANFSIAADTTQLHHYMITNNSFGKQPISYDWSWGDGTHDTIPYPTHTYADSGFYNVCLSITDSTGCQSSFCDSSFHAMRTTNTMVYITVVNPLLTGTKEATVQTPQVTIYPNPATDQLYINSNQSGKNTITIYNVLGQEASPPTPLQKRGENAVVDISKLPTGMYFVKLLNESSRWTGKFVKE